MTKPNLPSGNPTKNDYKTSGEGLPDDFELTEEFESAFQILENGPDVVFVTGRAGTGKSTLLRFFQLNTDKQVAVVAPTGVAALNVGGQTIHSFFRFPPRPIATADIKKLRDRRVYQAVDVLVIDEISMVRADMLDGIDRFMRLNGSKKHLPFGGARVIMFGDPYQLPPVVTNREEKQFLREHYESQYFFSANVFNVSFLETIELQQNFRQKEREFMDLLDEVRNKHSAFSAIQTLNERCLLSDGSGTESDGTKSNGTADGAIVLTSTNRRADAINSARLRALKTEEFTYEADTTGDFKTGSKSRFPAPNTLVLKVGAQVMFLRNSREQGFVNGSMGTVTDLSEDEIEVRIEDEWGGSVATIETSEWESNKYKYDPDTSRIQSEVVGTFTQYPLTLAWATTIHKSQGKTFDRVTLDLTDRAFEHGQVYVALSRCRTLDGLSLRVPLRARDIIVDSSVETFFAEATGERRTSD